MMKKITDMQAWRFSVLCLLAISLACGPGSVSLAQENIDPGVAAQRLQRCSDWYKTRSFRDLRACWLSKVHRGVSKASVVATLGPGELVTVPNLIWNPPREAFSYKAVDHDVSYIAVYEKGIIVERCSSSFERNDAGEAFIILE